MNNKTTLLIVEDDKAIVHFISSILSVNEYRTLYAGKGREAIALVASYRPDVVLLARRAQNRAPVVGGADHRRFRARAGTGKGACTGPGRG